MRMSLNDQGRESQNYGNTNICDKFLIVNNTYHKQIMPLVQYRKKITS